MSVHRLVLLRMVQKNVETVLGVVPDLSGCRPAGGSYLGPHRDRDVHSRVRLIAPGCTQLDLAPGDVSRFSERPLAWNSRARAGRPGLTAESGAERGRKGKAGSAGEWVADDIRPDHAPELLVPKLRAVQGDRERAHHGVLG